MKLAAEKIKEIVKFEGVIKFDDTKNDGTYKTIGIDTMGGKMVRCQKDFRSLAHEGYSKFSRILGLLGFEKSATEHAMQKSESTGIEII